MVGFCGEITFLGGGGGGRICKTSLCKCPGAPRDQPPGWPLISRIHRLSSRDRKLPSWDDKINRTLTK